MTFWRKLAHLIPSVRRASERDMQDEIESLREMAGPGALGNLTLAVEDARSELTWISLERLGQDLRYAVRILVKNFSFTVLCVLTLALGIRRDEHDRQLAPSTRRSTSALAGQAERNSTDSCTLAGTCARVIGTNPSFRK